MKKILSKIKNRISNSGSGIVLVIVALGFVGILAGALLTAVGYAYRLKLYDYNAKSNFFYLEQAMDEIYAGVGAQTMTAMQEAYEETKEQAVYYDLNQGVYRNIGNDKANALFKNRFMNKMNPSDTDTSNWFYLSAPHPFGTDNLIKNIEKLISNSTVKLDYSDMKVVKEVEAGIVKKVTIKNVRLKRTAEYTRSQASGTFEQTIQTDIEISRPDFDVNFDSSSVDIDNLFSYCMIADSGIEVNESAGTSLTINGNVYAASYFYNKLYNVYDGNDNLSETQKNHFNSLGVIQKNVTVDGETNTTNYNMNKVSSYDYVVGNEGYADDLYNHNKSHELGDVGSTAETRYDGYNFNSKYSGFFVNGSNVNFVGEYLVVPGSISVMNAGNLNVYGYSKEKSEISPANVWADEIVLAGNTKTTSEGKKYGSKAAFNANLYVKDDTQIESDYSELSLAGGYYGYSNSSTSDNRVFVPTTKKNANDIRTNIYQEQKGENVENRGHYNSSSIIVNGEHARLDLSKVELIYIAGRSYIELSQQKTGSRSYNTMIKDSNGQDIRFSTNDYEYNSYTKDYKTGESVSIKSNQIAYKPDTAPKKLKYKKNDAGTDWVDYTGQKYTLAPTLQDGQCDLVMYWCDVPTSMQNFYLFQKYFGYDKTGKQKSSVTRIPVVCKTQEVTVQGSTTKKSKTFYYIDFNYAANYETYMKDSTNTILPIKENENVADALSRQFIKDYADYVKYYDAYQAADGSDEYLYARNNTDTNLYEDSDSYVDQLKNIVQYEDFQAGQIALAQGITNTSTSTVTSYTSGALMKSGNTIIKSKDDKNVEFDVVLSKYSTLSNDLLGSTSTTANVSDALDYSNDFQKHYNYVKWSLRDLNPTSLGIDGIDTDVEVANKLIDDSTKDVGEASITPINKFMNFNNIYNVTPGDPYLKVNTTNFATDIDPNNLDLGDYKVWVSNDDVTIEADAADNNEVTGIVIAKGDVYFENRSDTKSVHKFNGIIISGGKIYLNNDLTTNISSSELCRNIINSLIVKAKNANSTDAAEKAEAVRACRVLTLFKEYEKYGTQLYTSEYTIDDSKPKDINMLDYSDVLRYNNWMRNVD